MPPPLPTHAPESGFYYHFKHVASGLVNNYAYEVLGIGFHTQSDAREGEEYFVLYRPLYDDELGTASRRLGVPCFYSRPLNVWKSVVERDGEIFPRYTEIFDPHVIAELRKKCREMYPER